MLRDLRYTKKEFKNNIIAKLIIKVLIKDFYFL